MVCFGSGKFCYLSALEFRWWGSPKGCPVTIVHCGAGRAALLPSGCGRGAAGRSSAVLPGSSAELLFCRERVPFYMESEFSLPSGAICSISRLPDCYVSSSGWILPFALFSKGHWQKGLQSVLVQQSILYSALNILLPAPVSGGPGCLLDSCLLLENKIALFIHRQ